MNFDSSRGLIHLRSVHSVAETMDRLESLIQAREIPIHARVDHSGDAAKAGLVMHPTVLLIFGNAKAGTPLMVAAPTVAIDLPLKALAWQDSAGDVWLSYNAPEYLAERHSLPEGLAGNLAVIATLCEQAAAA